MRKIIIQIHLKGYFVCKKNKISFIKDLFKLKNRKTNKLIILTSGEYVGFEDIIIN